MLANATVPMQSTSRPPEKEWLSRKEASRYLATLGCKIAPQTLAKMASNNNAGKGPPFYRFMWMGVQYRRDDLAKWAKRVLIRVE